MNSPMLKLLESAEEKANKLAAELSDPKVIADQRKFSKLSREHKDLAEIIEVGSRYRELLKTIAEARELREESEDPEMLELARQELEESEAKAASTEKELKLLLTPRDPNDPRQLVLLALSLSERGRHLNAAEFFLEAAERFDSRQNEFELTYTRYLF